LVLRPCNCRVRWCNIETYFLLFKKMHTLNTSLSQNSNIQVVLLWNQRTSPACSRGYSKNKISYKPWVNLASLSQYEPKWLFALIMVLSTKTTIMITMSYMPLNLFVVYQLEEVEKQSTWLCLW
jgi:hypothetical protein